MTTDPQPSTRERLLLAAIDAFSEVGFAGARVDAIARRAGCNKQLLYHHFRDKEGLYVAVIEAVLARKRPELTGTLSGLVDAAMHRFRTLGRERRWIRMMEWEALERGDQPSVGCAERRKTMLEEVTKLRDLQAAGEIRDDVAPELLLLQLIGMAMLPSLLPQMVSLLFGGPPDAGFDDRYADALSASLPRLLAPRPPES